MNASNPGVLRFDRTSHGRAKYAGSLSSEMTMIFLLVSSLALLSLIGGLSLRRLLSELPDRNIDFELAPADLDLERRP
jgi:hypothetical protein